MAGQYANIQRTHPCDTEPSQPKTRQIPHFVLTLWHEVLIASKHDLESPHFNASLYSLMTVVKSQDEGED